MAVTLLLLAVTHTDCSRLESAVAHGIAAVSRQGTAVTSPAPAGSPDSLWPCGLWTAAVHEPRTSSRPVSRIEAGAWGCNANLLRLAPRFRRPALARARAAGIAVFRDDFTNWAQMVSDSAAVLGCYQDYRAAGLDLLGMLCYGSPLDTVTSMPRALRDRAEPDKFPPRNLYADVFPPDGAAPNYWARYVERVMRALADVSFWEVWNEPNLSKLYFGDPDPQCYGTRRDPIDTPRERCSLYVRMCFIARTVADSLTALDSIPRLIAAGSVCGLTDRWPESGLSPGVTWLSDMLSIARKEYGDPARCFDLVSIHPYQHLKGPRGGKLMSFDETVFRADIETAAAVVGKVDGGHFDLWITELGWPDHDRSGRPASEPELKQAVLDRNAANLCKAGVSAVTGLEGAPACSRFFWYELTDRRDYGPAGEGFGLLDSSVALTEKPVLSSYRQLVRMLSGRRPIGFDGGNTTRQGVVHGFEDADGRAVWTVWRGRGTGLVGCPVRTDTVEVESLMVLGRPAVSRHPVQRQDGWLRLAAGETPLYVKEVGLSNRPDMVVDSVTVEPRAPRVGQRLTIRAWLRNQGTRPTPAGMPTRVGFICEGETLGHASVGQPIAAGRTARVEFVLRAVESRRVGPNLVAAVANPGQPFVELAVDNNARYELVRVGR